MLTSQQAKAQRIYAHAVLNYKSQREPVLAATRGPLACPSHGDPSFRDFLVLNEHQFFSLELFYCYNIFKPGSSTRPNSSHVAKIVSCCFRSLFNHNSVWTWSQDLLCLGENFHNLMLEVFLFKISSSFRSEILSTHLALSIRVFESAVSPENAQAICRSISTI